MPIVIGTIIVICFVVMCGNNDDYNAKKENIILFCICVVLSAWLLLGYRYAKFQIISDGPYRVQSLNKGDYTIQVVTIQDEIINLTAAMKCVLPENSYVIREKEVGGWSCGIYWEDDNWKWKQIQLEKR